MFASVVDMDTTFSATFMHTGLHIKQCYMFFLNLFMCIIITFITLNIFVFYCKKTQQGDFRSGMSSLKR